MDSATDKLSFTNQGVFQYFIRKIFYNKSNLQCNSVITTNTRFHDHNETGSIYPPFGFQPDEIYQFVLDNLNNDIHNPLFKMLEQYKNYTGLSGEWDGLRNILAKGIKK